MVDPGEGVTTTLVRFQIKHSASGFFLFSISSVAVTDQILIRFVQVHIREFMEEALDSIETGSTRVSHRNKVPI